MCRQTLRHLWVPVLLSCPTAPRPNPARLDNVPKDEPPECVDGEAHIARPSPTLPKRKIRPAKTTNRPRRNVWPFILPYTLRPQPSTPPTFLRRSVGHAPFQRHIALATSAARVTAHADNAANTISESKISAPNSTPDAINIAKSVQPDGSNFTARDAIPRSKTRRPERR